jgi:hypothetical protein
LRRTKQIIRVCQDGGFYGVSFEFGNGGRHERIERDDQGAQRAPSPLYGVSLGLYGSLGVIERTLTLQGFG